jgi:hypothetical protein
VKFTPAAKVKVYERTFNDKPINLADHWLLIEGDRVVM